MAFGGYKFKGYKVVRANLTNNTYANWCLLVHQARIKAFMESCALSGAQWHFSKTNGALGFESYGNVIYRVANANGDYHDYLSFFQYGNEELYYMISTLGEYYQADNGTPALVSGAKYTASGSSTASSRERKWCGMGSALSLSEFADNGPFGTYPTDALACSSVASDATSSGTNSIDESATYAMLSRDSIKIGYATKEKDILTFTNETGHYCIESGDAFSFYCEPNDHYGLMKLVLCNTNNSEWGVNSYESMLIISNRHAECLTSSGGRAYYDDSSSAYARSKMGPSCPKIAYLGSNSITKLPFEAVGLNQFSHENINHTRVQFGNSCFLSKGLIRQELFCMNAYPIELHAGVPTMSTVYLGGNLLSATAVYSSSQIYYYEPSGDRKYCPIAYVGWDPSNPDITNESSWPELALQE